MSCLSEALPASRPVFDDRTSTTFACQSDKEVSSFQAYSKDSKSATANCTMPLDYTSYLFASSPPASELFLFSGVMNDSFIGCRRKYSNGAAACVLSTLPMVDNNHNKEHRADLVPTESLPVPEAEKEKSSAEIVAILSRALNIQTAATVTTVTSTASSPYVADAIVDDNWSCSSCSLSSRVEEGEEAVRKQNKGGLKGKKRVSFADMNGRALTEVRVFKESPDEPPKVTGSLLDALRACAQADATEDVPTLSPAFSQPAADYVSFHRRLEQQNVSLENVVVRGQKTISGTVKVKNVDFHKHVSVRWTSDGWATHHDVEATYLPSGAAGASQYDTFQFQFDADVTERFGEKLEMAVCFRSGSQEFWDSNGGRNYVMVHSQPRGTAEGPRSVFELPPDSQVEWTRFSAWQDLVTVGPYW